MTRPRQTTISREGWYYLVVLALVLGGAMLREVNLLLVLAGMLAGPLLLSWRAVGRTLRGLQVQRHVPQGVCAGDLLVAQLTLTNTRRRFGTWGVVVEEQIQREADGQPANQPRETPIRPGVLFPYVAAGESRAGVYRGRLAQRGRYCLGPLRLSTRFPFGLFSRAITFGQSDTLVVLPRLGRLTRHWAARRRRSLAGTHRRERRHGPEGDFYGVRPWRSGDSRRWIHWRTSARVGELVVRQFEQPRNRDLAVLVDLWQPEQPAEEHLENVELAVSFAATVVADLCRQGESSVWLGTTGKPSESLRGSASVPLLQEALQRLAVAQAHHDDRLPELLARALADVEPGTEIVLLATRPTDLSEASRFGPSLSAPARRALVQNIRCIDTSSDDLAQFYRPE